MVQGKHLIYQCIVPIALGELARFIDFDTMVDITITICNFRNKFPMPGHEGLLGRIGFPLNLEFRLSIWTSTRIVFYLFLLAGMGWKGPFSRKQNYDIFRL